MKCYQPSMPRAKLGFAAFAMTAITVSVMVALPATLESSSVGESALTATGSATGAPAAIEGHLARADVRAIKPVNQRLLRSHANSTRQ